MKYPSKIQHGTELRIKQELKVRIREDVISTWEEKFPVGTKALFGCYSRPRQRPAFMCQKEEFFNQDEMELGKFEPATVAVFINRSLYEFETAKFKEHFELLGEEAEEGEILRN